MRLVWSCKYSVFVNTASVVNVNTLYTNTKKKCKVGIMGIKILKLWPGKIVDSNEYTIIPL